MITRTLYPYRSSLKTQSPPPIARLAKAARRGSCCALRAPVGWVDRLRQPIGLIRRRNDDRFLLGGERRVPAAQRTHPTDYGLRTPPGGCHRSVTLSAPFQTVAAIGL